LKVETFSITFVINSCFSISISKYIIAYLNFLTIYYSKNWLGNSNFANTPLLI
jgi:hypothetical protein